MTHNVSIWSQAAYHSAKLRPSVRVSVMSWYGGRPYQPISSAAPPPPSPGPCQPRGCATQFTQMLGTPRGGATPYGGGDDFNLPPRTHYEESNKVRKHHKEHKAPVQDAAAAALGRDTRFMSGEPSQCSNSILTWFISGFIAARRGLI